MDNQETILTVDPKRMQFICGIPIRAKLGDKWGAYDLAQLDRLSLIHWLNGHPLLAINTVLALFDHDHIDSPT